MSNIDAKMWKRVTTLCATHYNDEIFDCEYDDEDLTNLIQEHDTVLDAYMETLNQTDYTNLINAMFELLDYNTRVATD